MPSQNANVAWMEAQLEKDPGHTVESLRKIAPKDVKVSGRGLGYARKELGLTAPEASDEPAPTPKKGRVPKKVRKVRSKARNGAEEEAPAPVEAGPVTLDLTLTVDGVSYTPDELAAIVRRMNEIRTQFS